MSINASPEEPIHITNGDLGNDAESDIEITSADFINATPDVEITYKDLARNPLEWMQGALKDFQNGLKTKSGDQRWWGNDDLGIEKLSTFEIIEKERDDVEKIIVEILDSPEIEIKTWRELTDNEIGEVEIKLIEDTLKLEIEDEIAIEVEGDESLLELEGLSESERNRILWDRYIREREEYFDAQTRSISNLYSDRIVQTPIMMERHHRQQYAGHDGIYTCAVASTLNGLHALKAAESSDNEDSIIEAVGGRQVFHENGGYLPMGRIYDFLRSRELLVQNSGSMLELLQTLENGGIGIIAYGQHARMISGAESRDDQIFLRMHDPFETEVSFISTTDLMKKINQSQQFYNMFLVENPVSIDIVD